MDQFLTFWNGLGLRRQAIAIAATLGMFLGVLLIGRSAMSVDYALLYSGLDAAAAGEIVTALEQEGVPYVIEGGSIRVPRAQRDRLRMVMAGQGLPANGPAGYELLDSLSGFGTTSQMFDAAYWRAKEGELARTIMANPAIRNARVHISNIAARPFQRENGAAASVFVTSAGPSGLAGPQARALRFLVASAVAGLGPEDVTIIDGTTGEIIEAGDAMTPDRTSADRAAELRLNILRLVEAHVGIGNAVVEVNVDTISESETIFERRIDPEGRVAISSDTTERVRNSEGGQAGTVTVASNLPDGDAAANGGGPRNSDTEARALVNYEVSETTREVRRTPGAIRRLSVAVLVDGHRTAPEADGAPEWRARSDDELDALRALVASAVGFDEARGDSITIRSMPLQTEALPPALTEDLGGIRFADLDPMALVNLAVFALVTIILGLFVLRPILRGTPQALPTEARGNGLLTDMGPNAVLDASQPYDGLPDLGQIGGAAPGFLPEMAIGDFTYEEPLLPPPPIPVDAEAVARLRNLITERREETLEVLRGWMEAADEHDGEIAR